MLPLFIAAMEDDIRREFMEELYLRYSAPMLKKAFAVVCDKGLAEDVVQSTFLLLIQKADMLMEVDPAKLPYYLMAAARNAAVDALRKQKKAVCSPIFASDDCAADPSAQPEEIYIHEELLQSAAESVAALGERDRLLLEAKYLLEKTDEEISAQFGISVNSVRSALSRARRRAYKILQRSDA